MDDPLNCIWQHTHAHAHTFEFHVHLIVCYLNIIFHFTSFYFSRPFSGLWSFFIVFLLICICNLQLLLLFWPFVYFSGILLLLCGCTFNHQILMIEKKFQVKVKGRIPGTEIQMLYGVSQSLFWGIDENIQCNEYQMVKWCRKKFICTFRLNVVYWWVAVANRITMCAIKLVDDRKNFNW